MTIAAAVVTGTLLMSVAAVAIIEPDSGSGRGLVDAIENRIRENEALHYQIHRALGWAFSLCPCTARLSASQRSKAAFHRPGATPSAPYRTVITQNTP